MTETLTPKPKSKDELAHIFFIDKYDLDEVWVSQPRYMRKFTHLLVEARAKFDKYKAQKDFISAEIDLAIRKDPEGFKVGKLTEAVIEKTIIVSDRYQEANNKVLRAKKEMDELSVIVDALHDRRKSAEKLVDLALAEYFAEPIKPKNVTPDQIDDLKMNARKKRLQRNHENDQ